MYLGKQASANSVDPDQMLHSQQGAFNEYPKHMLLLRTKKNISTCNISTEKHALSGAMVNNKKIQSAYKLTYIYLAS